MHFLLCPSKRWSAAREILFHPPKNQTFFLNFGNVAQKMQMMEEGKNFSTFNNSSHFCRFPWKLWRALVGARARDSLLRFLRWGMGGLLLRGSRSYLCAPSLSSCPTTAALRTHVPVFRRVLLRMIFVGTDVKRQWQYFCTEDQCACQWDGVARDLGDVGDAQLGVEQPEVGRGAHQLGGQPWRGGRARLQGGQHGGRLQVWTPRFLKICSSLYVPHS